MNNPTFIGWQELPPGIGGGKMALFNLNEPLAQHPAGSTVSDRTLMQHGWSVLQVAGLITNVFALRSNGDPSSQSSCDAGRVPVTEISGSQSSPATDAAGNSHAPCNNPAASEISAH